jgi:hypothetical protein
MNNTKNLLELKSNKTLAEQQSEQDERSMDRILASVAKVKAAKTTQSA